MISELNNFANYILKSRLLILGFIIYFSFNISAFRTSWFDYFFFGSSIHYCCKGMDFYSIPNGIYAFIKGGDITGRLPNEQIKPYSYPHVANSNVYHPLLTILVGTPLIIFPADISIELWNVIKIFVTIVTAFYIFRNFQDNKHLSFALFYLLINFSQYNDIKLSQYQFLLNIFLVYLLINIAKHKSTLEGGILYFLTLLVKPIGLLWLPALILKKKFTIAILGAVFFAFSTLTFYFLDVGVYFIANLKTHLLNPRATEGIDFMSLDAFLRYTFNLSADTVKYLKYLVLGIIYLAALKKAPSIIRILFLLVLYFLFFYDFVFQYHWSILGPLFAVSVLILPEFQTKLFKILALMLSLPTVFFLLRFFNLHFEPSPVYGPNPTLTGWQIVSFFQLLPATILFIMVLLKEITFKDKLVKHGIHKG